MTHAQYLKALGTENLYGISNAKWVNGYVIFNNVEIDHVSEDYLFTTEGEAHIRSICQLAEERARRSTPMQDTYSQSVFNSSDCFGLGE